MIKKTVLFVCSGNINRSPMAEGLLRKFLHDANIINIESRSAGTLRLNDFEADDKAINVCKNEFAIDISTHRSRGISLDMLNTADLILCMSSNHLHMLLTLAPNIKNKCFVLKEYANCHESDSKVHDPIGKDYQAYKKICCEIAILIKNALPKIITELKCK